MAYSFERSKAADLGRVLASRIPIEQFERAGSLRFPSRNVRDGQRSCQGRCSSNRKRSAISSPLRTTPPFGDDLPVRANLQDREESRSRTRREIDPDHRHAVLTRLHGKPSRVVEALSFRSMSDREEKLLFTETNQTPLPIGELQVPLHVKEFGQGFSIPLVYCREVTVQYPADNGQSRCSIGGGAGLAEIPRNPFHLLTQTGQGKFSRSPHAQSETLENGSRATPDQSARRARAGSMVNDRRAGM
jgi:hypothetical protein